MPTPCVSSLLELSMMKLQALAAGLSTEALGSGAIKMDEFMLQHPDKGALSRSRAARC